MICRCVSQLAGFHDERQHAGGMLHGGVQGQRHGRVTAETEQNPGRGWRGFQSSGDRPHQALVHNPNVPLTGRHLATAGFHAISPTPFHAQPMNDRRLRIRRVSLTVASTCHLDTPPGSCRRTIEFRGSIAPLPQPLLIIWISLSNRSLTRIW